MAPRYNLRRLPHRLWLTPLLYELPEELLRRIALMACVLPCRFVRRGRGLRPARV